MITKEQSVEVDRLLHDAHRAYSGHEMAQRMNDPENAKTLLLKAVRLFSQAHAIDPNGEGFAWFQ